MLHPLAVSTGFFEDHLSSWQGLNGSSLISLQFAQDDAARGFRGGAKWSLQPMGGGPAMESFKLLASRIDPSRYHGEFARRFGRNLMFSIMCEDMPDPDNRVTLSTSVFDSSGLAAPKLSYRISADARACLQYNCEQAEGIFREAGAWHAESRTPAPYNAHFMGTACMGDDPKTSVVDPWCMSHDIPNLGIIDGSVFVTAAAVNPTATIAALALRASRRLVENLSTIPSARHDRPVVYDLRPPVRATPKEAAPPLAVSPEQRRTLSALGDALIPPVEDVPGAGSVLCDQGFLEKVLSVRPDFATPLARALKIDASAFHTLAATDAEAWMAALQVIAYGYCLHPEVKQRIGYEGQIAKPARLDNFPAYIAEGLLDHLIEGRWEFPKHQV